MSIHNTRLLAFIVWLVLALGYVIAFMLTARRPEISKTEALEAAWTVGYIFGPILVGFAQFYLGPGSDRRLKGEKSRRVHTHQLVVMMLLTLGCHALLILYFSVFVWFAQFGFSNKESDSFIAAVNFGFKLMLGLGTLPIFGVNYLLNRDDIAFGQPQAK